MTKIEGYECDNCNSLKESDDIVGVLLVEDLFDSSMSFPTVPNPAKSDCHYCLSCYNRYVLAPAANQVNRERDEYLYKLKVVELGSGLRRSTVAKFRLKKH